MRVGKFLIETLPMPLRYMQDEGTPLFIIIPVVAGVLLVVVVISLIIICCVVCLYRQKIKKLKKNQDWIKLVTTKDALNKMAHCTYLFTHTNKLAYMKEYMFLSQNAPNTQIHEKA